MVSRNRITERCTDESCGLTFVQLPQKDDEVKLLKKIISPALAVGFAPYGNKAHLEHQFV